MSKSTAQTVSEFQNVAVIPFKNMVLFPGRSIPVGLTSPRGAKAVEFALKDNHNVIVVTQKSSDDQQEPDPKNLYRVGVLAKLQNLRGDAQKGYQATLHAVCRVHINAFHQEGTFIVADANTFDDILDCDNQTRVALVKSIKDLGLELLKMVPADTRQVQEYLSAVDDLNLMTYLCAENVEATVDEKQNILETLEVKERSLKLLELLQKQKEALQLQGEIRNRLNSKAGKMQREAILREQMNAIKEELNESSDKTKGGDYKKRINEAGLPDEVKEIALEEADRLEGMNSQSPETSVIKNYLDLILALPWNKSSVDQIDLEAARQLLDQEHFGMEKVKKRILQHLAVLKLKGSGKGSMLLLIGPPGVGKTSLGESIAKSMGRKFVRASLGGVRDDAEIRGHRRTYIGALPGKIIQSIKRAGVNNPVFLLDEIDKLGRSFSGDPAAALLEVLDPEQNSTFADHFLDVPFDLSKVFFIATANSMEGIPGPLLDRMEVIELSGYTTPEKLHIAKRHLLPKKIVEHGLTAEQLQVSDEALIQIISSYTREAGVRDLQRKLATLCRVASEKIVSQGESKQPVVVEKGHLEEFLGPEKFVFDIANMKFPPGVVTGLAWTPVGGDILFVEAKRMHGTGKLTLTGQLGDVMKESAQIALSLSRVHLSAHVPEFKFQESDIHIHVPSGAIPKDGPSAGVTLLTTIASLLINKPVDSKIAMTGEITLRGAVTPVGGIKEKVLAAHRAGIKEIIMSSKNEKDLRDVPEDVKSQMKFHFADNVSEVLKISLDIDSFESLNFGFDSNSQPSPLQNH